MDAGSERRRLKARSRTLLKITDVLEIVNVQEDAHAREAKLQLPAWMRGKAASQCDKRGKSCSKCAQALALSMREKQTCTAS